MSDYMREAERLIAAHESAIRQHDRGSEWDEGPAKTLATLLAHIQRGAVPEGWQVVPKVASDAMLRPFYECPPEELQLAWQAAVLIAKTQAKREASLQNIVSESERLGLYDASAAPVPDQFRDAALREGKPTPASDSDMEVYQSIADGYARDTALAPAEVPMPEMQDLLDWVSACQSAYHIDSTPGHRFGGLGSNLEYNRAELVSTVQEMLRTYGAACRAADEAAGYARGLAEAGRDAERLDYIERNARCDPKMDGQHVWWPTNFSHRLIGPTIRDAIDAALRGEVKP